MTNTAVSRFIRDAVKGGYEPKYSTPEHIDHWYGMEERKSVCIPQVILDAASWRAVAEARGWGDDTAHYCECWHGDKTKWELNMHGLIDALAEGKTIEAYLSSIE